MNKNLPNKGMITVAMIFGVGIFSIGIAFLVSNAVISNMINNRNSLLSTHTFYASESALREGAYQIINASTTYTGGSFPLINSVLSNAVTVQFDAYPELTVSASADNGITTRNSVVKMTLFPAAAAFDHAIYSLSSLEIGGNTDIEGNVFANGDINFNGVSAEIDGDAYASGDVDTSSGNVTGDSVSTVGSGSQLIIDPTVYIATSTLDGTYFANETLAENYLNGETRVDEIIYVAGVGNDTHITSNNTYLYGALIVEGDLTLKNAEIHRGSTYPYDDPLVIYVGGDLHLTGNAEIEGIVYVKGGTSFSGGSNTIRGSLISLNTVDTLSVTGNVTIEYDPTLAGDWEDISGIDTTTGEPPKIMSWGEN